MFLKYLLKIFFSIEDLINTWSLFPIENLL